MVLLFWPPMLKVVMSGKRGKWVRERGSKLRITTLVSSDYPIISYCAPQNQKIVYIMFTQFNDLGIQCSVQLPVWTRPRAWCSGREGKNLYMTSPNFMNFVIYHPCYSRAQATYGHCHLFLGTPLSPKPKHFGHHIWIGFQKGEKRGIRKPSRNNKLYFFAAASFPAQQPLSPPHFWPENVPARDQSFLPLHKRFLVKSKISIRSFATWELIAHLYKWQLIMQCHYPMGFPVLHLSYCSSISDFLLALQKLSTVEMANP